MATRKRGLWESVYYAIVQSRTLTVSTTTYLPRERVHIDRILGAFLEAAGMVGLKNNLAYCVHELAGNAKKANVKRLYFQQKGLNIFDSSDYTLGMEKFKSESSKEISHYHALLKENGMYVKFQFRRQKRGVRVNIRNNSVLTAAEQSRINEKVAIAARYTCLSDAYSSSQDRSEGAGLGIVMMLFMLKNLGFGPEAFSIHCAANETVATLNLTVPAEAELVEIEDTATA